jgi:putative zinc finger/helix-turn-helix YgiT family protein
LATVSHTSQVKHDGRLYAVEVPRLRVPQCAACGELVFDNAADEQIAQALREQLGLLLSSDIRRQREELNLSQRQLAEYLGVAVETISRWETGALTQSRAMDRYLRVYFGLPEVRMALLAETMTPLAPSEIH